MAAPEPYQPTERRPIASRKSRLWIKTADWLAARGVSSNAISLAGMAAGVASGAALAMTGRVGPVASSVLWLAGAVFAQLRLIGNLLDGMVAIASGKASRVGELYNEVPDRVSDPAILVGLGYAAGGVPWLGYTSAILAMFVAYVRAEVRVAGAPQDYRGPMAKPHRMAVVTGTAVLCAVSPESWWTFGPSWGLPAAASAVICLGCVVTAARRLRKAARLLSGAN